MERVVKECKVNGGSESSTVIRNRVEERKKCQRDGIRNGIEERRWWCGEE